MNGKPTRGIWHLADSVDQMALSHLLREAPMDDWVRLQLLREPDYFAADALMGQARTVILRSTEGKLGAMGRAHLLPVHINGTPTSAAYLGGLRIATPFRHRRWVLREGFAALQEQALPSAAIPCFTSIAQGNSVARRILEAGLAGLPRYRPVGSLRTLVMATRQGRPEQILRQANRRDIPAIADFFNRQAASWQYSVVLKENWLAELGPDQFLSIDDFFVVRHANDIVACVALWDQRRIKQTVVHSYRSPLRVLRHPYNAWAALRGRVGLPAPTRQLDQAYLAFLASTLPIRETLELLRDALWQLQQRGIAVGVLGLATGNPLRVALEKAWPCLAYDTKIESVCFGEDPLPGLDGRSPQPEAALL